MESFTTPAHSINNYNKTWMQNAGALVAASAKFDEHWDGALGVGTMNVHLSRGRTTNANIWYPFWISFVTEARVTRTSTLFTENDKLSLTLGSFGYNYNPDAKNLGLYLLHGYVYPGAIVSGFTGPLGPVAATTGGMVGYRNGKFGNDLIVISETDDKPLYDFSLADVVTYDPVPGFEIGAGANLYRLIPQNKRLTSPKADCRSNTELGEYNNGCFERDSIGVTPDGNIVYDTILGSLAGTKLMARFRLDPKALFGFDGGLGQNELVLYGEAALLGVKNVGNYYAKRGERIPVMVGFNFPTWKVLDNLSLEVEYYGSKNNADNLAAQYGSWVPIVDPNSNTKRDDWKWSVNVDKVISGHIKGSLQVANDHMRLGGYHNYATGVETTTTPKDWYWTGKVVYFF
jgi:hypothetical protein